MDTLRCQGGNPFNLSISILEHFMEGLGQHHLVEYIHHSNDRRPTLSCKMGGVQVLS